MHVCMKYIGYMDMCHIYSVGHIYARYIYMCDLEIDFKFEN